MVKTIVSRGSFEWDEQKEAVNIQKHGIDFSTARFIFKDTHLRSRALEKMEEIL